MSFSSWPFENSFLRRLEITQTLVADYSVLSELPLQTLFVDVPLQDRVQIDFLRRLPLKEISLAFSDKVQPRADFWKEFEDRRQQAQAFIEETAPLSIQKQIEAVQQRLKRLDSEGRSSIEPVIRGGQIVECIVTLSGSAGDISPLLAFRGLKKLTFKNSPSWLDLSPITELPLEELMCRDEHLIRNGRRLARMSTLKIVNGQPAAEFLKEYHQPDHEIIVYPEPPPLAQWMEDRDVLTVKQDGTAMFTTIQAALNAQRDGQVVRVLDKGPYREQLSWSYKQNCGLVTDQETIIELEKFTLMRSGHPEKNGHKFYYLTDCRLSGFTFLFVAKEEVEKFPLDFYLIESTCIENCVVAPMADLPATGASLIQISLREMNPESMRSVWIRDCLWRVAVSIFLKGHGGNEEVGITRNWFRPVDQGTANSLSVHRNDWPQPISVRIEKNVICSAHQAPAVSLGGGRSVLNVLYQGNTQHSRYEPLSVFDQPAIVVEILDNIHSVKRDVCTFYNEAQTILPLARQHWPIAGNYSRPGSEVDRTYLRLSSPESTQPFRFLSEDPLHPDYLRVDPASITILAGDVFPGALPPGPAPESGDWLTRLQDRYRALQAVLIK